MTSNDKDLREIIWRIIVVASTIVVALYLGLLLIVILNGCSPKVITKTETVIEYRDREIHDTTTFEIPVEVEKIVTRDTASHLENTYAKSDAVVSQGFLSHSLESIPQIVKVPYEVHVTDTLYKESEVITETEYVEKELTWWQQFRLDAFWWLVAILLASAIWIFRKPLLSLFSK